MILAAHDFQIGPGGTRCKTCDRRLIDVLTVTADAIGQRGVSCYGVLSDGEYAGIEAYREHLWRAVADAASAGV